MYLFDLPDIGDKVRNILEEECFDLQEADTCISEFLAHLDTKMRDKIREDIAIEAECPDKKDILFDYMHSIVISNTMTDEGKRNELRPLLEAFATCSDDEEACGHKIYVVIKGMDLVEEYDSWETAEKEIDDWYVGCCDDAYIAECLLFQLLCYVQSREYDYTKNFCTVIEFNATDIEEGREAWEAENCDFESADNI